MIFGFYQIKLFNHIPQCVRFINRQNALIRFIWNFIHYFIKYINSRIQNGDFVSWFDIFKRKIFIHRDCHVLFRIFVVRNELISKRVLCCCTIDLGVWFIFHFFSKPPSWHYKCFVLYLKCCIKQCCNIS